VILKEENICQEMLQIQEKECDQNTEAKKIIKYKEFTTEIQQMW
jgi:hypothetical protein